MTDGRILSQLRAAQSRPRIWSGCPPDNAAKSDDDLRYMREAGLIYWNRSRGGYQITAEGAAAIRSRRLPPHSLVFTLTDTF